MIYAKIMVNPYSYFPLVAAAGRVVAGVLSGGHYGVPVLSGGPPDRPGQVQPSRLFPAPAGARGMEVGDLQFHDAWSAIHLLFEAHQSYCSANIQKSGGKYTKFISSTL